MALAWNAAGDFTEVIDTLEPVTLRRPDGSTVSTSAWRFAQRASDPTSGVGALRRLDVTWHLPTESGAEPPWPGDVIEDAAGDRTWVREASLLRGTTRYVCQTRRTEVVEALAERFDLERPEYDDSPEGPVIVGWDEVASDVLGYFDESGEQVVVTLGETVEAAVGDRLARATGDLYGVTKRRAPPGLGELWSLVVEPIAS